MGLQAPSQDTSTSPPAIWVAQSGRMRLLSPQWSVAHTGGNPGRSSQRIRLGAAMGNGQHDKVPSTGTPRANPVL